MQIIFYDKKTNYNGKTFAKYISQCTTKNLNVQIFYSIFKFEMKISNFKEKEGHVDILWIKLKGMVHQQ